MHEIDVFVKWIFQHEKILLVEVGLGNIETVSKQDKTRKSPSSLEFDSIIVSQNPFCGKIYCFLWFFCQAKELIIKFYHPNKWKYQNIGNHFKCVNNSFLLFFFCSHFWLPFGYFHVPVFLTFPIDFFQTPGRLHTSQGVGDMIYNEEYIVYNISQVMPLCLISYAGTWGRPNNPRPLHPHQSTPRPPLPPSESSSRDQFLCVNLSVVQNIDFTLDILLQVIALFCVMSHIYI